MKLKLIVAAIAILAVPVCAQAQKAKATKADAQKVVQIISADKAKSQIYCDMVKLGDQLEQADQKKDDKKVDELSKKMEDMTKKLGPEYVALTDALQGIDQNSKAGKEIGEVLEGLDKLCAK